MKKLVVLGILIVALAATASAQVDRPLKFYAGGGLAFPVSPSGFTDGWGLGFHGKLAVGFNPPSVPALEILGKFEYHTFGSDIDGLDGGDFRPMLFGVDAKLKFGLPDAPTRFYALGGAGISSWEYSDIDTDDLDELDDFFGSGESETDFYLNGGLGVDLSPAEAFGVFVEGRIVAILTEGDATLFVPITAGFKF